MNRNVKTVLALVAGLALGALLVTFGGPLLTGTAARLQGGSPAPATGDLWWRGETDDCGPDITQAQLDESLQLGSAFMLHNQLDAGNFAYEWDWKAQRDATDDNEVRQAGATWGLALILQDDPSRTDVRDALLKSLDFWSTQIAPASRAEGEARHWVLYKDAAKGSTGTIALLALAHIELLRAGVALPPEREATLRADLDGLLAMLVAQRASKGGFHGFFKPDGTPFGRANPYADGESLLAMVKAANYLGRDDLLPHAVAWAKEDRTRNVLLPRQSDPDPDTTKGYYQWTSMAWWELAHSSAAGEADWSEWTMELAVWMIDDHRTLKRTRNTAYAYEGIVSAYDLAKEKGDPRAAKFACVIHQGLHKLTSWQLGHSLANDYVAKAPADDVRGRGGIQNIKNEPGLRIDVTQHQMHAVILARRALQ